jgi:hypothetical protein
VQLDEQVTSVSVHVSKCANMVNGCDLMKAIPDGMHTEAADLLVPAVVFGLRLRLACTALRLGYSCKRSAPLRHLACCHGTSAQVRTRDARKAKGKLMLMGMLTCKGIVDVLPTSSPAGLAARHADNLSAHLGRDEVSRMGGSVTTSFQMRLPASVSDASSLRAGS